MKLLVLKAIKQIGLAREKQEESYINSLKEGKLSLSQNDFKNAKNYFLFSFSIKKTIEIAHLLSTCFSNLKEYEYASKFFEKKFTSLFRSWSPTGVFSHFIIT